MDMNVLILPDSFKNCLTSVEVGDALAEGVLRVFPDAVVRKFPVADGGEGTVDAFVAAANGKKIACKAHDALGREINAFYGLLPDGTAVVEMAAASGIERISDKERNPLVASTFGTGEVIAKALEQGVKKIVLGLGGSATNDGGTGMAKALGYKFLDKNGNELREGGGALAELASIDASGVLPALRSVTFKVAVDVQNPLTGLLGASHVYGPQKGATPQMVEILDNNLSHLAKIITKDLGKEVEFVPGAGAAGGMGAGSLAFLNGELVPGFGIVTEVLQLSQKIAEADVVLTGEGMMDEQTLQGKTPFSVAQIAAKQGKKVFAFAGTLGAGYRALYNHGFTSVFPITEKPMTLAESMDNAAALLSNAAERAFRVLK